LLSLSLIKKLSKGISHLPSCKSCFVHDLSDRNTFFIVFHNFVNVCSKSTHVEGSTLEIESVVDQVILFIVVRVASLYSGIKNRKVFGSTFIILNSIQFALSLTFGR